MEAAVVIAGGGPAGAATALTLARRGVGCLVLEAASGVQRKVGETIPPNAAPLFRALGLEGCLAEPRHLACYGNRYLWGEGGAREKLFLLHTHGHGWHLDRRAFEESLGREARKRGVEWWAGCRLLAAERRTGGGWRVTVDRGGERRELAARFLVDATGRASRLGRELGVGRRGYDRLLGLACPLRLGAGQAIAQYTYVEAVADGWWYAALLPGGCLMTAFMTDADRLDRALLEGGAYRDALRRTRLIGPLLDAAGLEEQGRVVARTASSSRLRWVAGDGWLAVGDAAFAYDPVSSYGLTSALGGGFYAGNAAADHLRGRPEALPAYEAVTERGYRLYLEMLRHQYRLERRWPRSPFWRRRHDAGFARDALSRAPPGSDRGSARSVTSRSAAV